MNKKKVLMVHNYYQIGGGEHTVFENEVNLLREQGHEVIEYTRSNDELKESKFKMLLLPFTTLWSFKTYYEVKKIIKKQKIDVVHCHNTFPLISPSVYYAARSLKIPTIQTIHNFRFLCPNGVFYRDGKMCEDCNKKNSFMPALKHKCYRGSKAQTLSVVLMLKIHRNLGTYNKINYIFLTEFNKMKFDKFINVHSDNVFVKSNFVKTSLNYYKKTCKEKIFVFAGRLEENKGIKFLLDQWMDMPEEYRLHIYGSGTLEKYVQEKIKDMNNIIYFGFQTSNVIFDDLKRATSLVFPSLWYEGFPMILGESMAIGCPVISTNIGNAGDIVVHSKGGVAFDINTKDSFKMALDKCISKNTELSLNARHYYENNLSKDKQYEYMINIYNNAKCQ